MGGEGGAHRPGCRVPGQRQNDEARVPPSQALPLLPRMPALKTFTPGGAAVVVHEDDQRVLRDAPLVEFRQQPADVLVDVVDHAEEVRGIVHWATLPA